MELTVPVSSTLKINTKKGYILVNSDTTADAKVVILDDNSRDIPNNSGALIIYGPGDFEASEILIRGTRPDNATMYGIDTGEGRLLYVVSNSISKISDEDDYDVVVVKAITPVEEAALSALSSQLIVVYGDEQNIPEAIKTNTVNKVNLKKKEELGSNIVYLAKK